MKQLLKFFWHIVSEDCFDCRKIWNAGRREAFSSLQISNGIEVDNQVYPLCLRLSNMRYEIADKPIKRWEEQ